MAPVRISVMESRRDQAFPLLEDSEVARVRRFGSLRSYSSGGMLAEAGKPLDGFAVILSGDVNVTRRTTSGDGELIFHGHCDVCVRRKLDLLTFNLGN
jgi:thioredoxin reductase (NADPH)